MEEKILDVMRRVFCQDVDNSCSQENCDKWDSMNHLNLIVELEMEFDITFEPEEIAEMRDFNAVANMINNKLK